MIPCVPGAFAINPVAVPSYISAALKIAPSKYVVSYYYESERINENTLEIHHEFVDCHLIVRLFLECLKMSNITEICYIFPRKEKDNSDAHFIITDSVLDEQVAIKAASKGMQI